MKRVFLALVVTCSAALSTVTVTGQQGQRGLPACDPENGGLTLPAGFCALVVHKGVNVNARHLLVMPNGDVFVSIRATGQTPGALLGLRDTNGNGKLDDPGDLSERFGTGAHGLVYRNGYLYYATPTTIERFKLNPGELKPAGAAEVIVKGMRGTGGHNEKDIAFDDQGNVYVNIGLPSNACAIPDRQPGGKGQDPCPQLEDGGGIWRFKADVPNQEYSRAAKYATGMRQPVALAWHNGRLYAAMNSRDSLDTLYPKMFTAEDNALRPLEPLLEINQGDQFGWPYCFFDKQAGKMILAPEYGGDGKSLGRCAQYKAPAATFPAHYAPVGLMAYTGTQFPAKYRGGLFMTSHGSWNRAPLPQGGYNILYQPFANGHPAGEAEVFADGFKGSEPLLDPSKAVARPNGTAQGPDGSLYITESSKGKIWRVIYRAR